MAIAISTFVLEMALRYARPQIEAGADVIGIGDAAASLVGPKIYDQFIWPYEKKLVDGLHALGTKVRLHICGNTRHIAEGMGRLGCEIVDLDYLIPVAGVVPFADLINLSLAGRGLGRVVTLLTLLPFFVGISGLATLRSNSGDGLARLLLVVCLVYLPLQFFLFHLSDAIQNASPWHIVEGLHRSVRFGALFLFAVVGVATTIHHLSRARLN